MWYIKKFPYVIKIVSFVMVISWTLIMILHYQLISIGSSNTYGIFTKRSSNNYVIPVKVRKFNSSGEYFVDRTINLAETVAYYDMWRSHWCTYYNDREYFFTPRINEILQMLRQFKVPVVTISMSIDAYQPNCIQRKRGKVVVAKGALPILENYHEQKERYHKDYIPGFKDTCVYKDQERFGKYRNNRITKAIAVTDEDYFVQNFKESAEAFVGLGAKTVLIFGQHSNMCLMAVFLYCSQVGLDLIIVNDLVDGCWLYEYQYKHAKNHTAGNIATNNYIDQFFGCSIISYDLISALRRLKAKRVKPEYTSFTSTAYMFKYF